MFVGIANVCGIAHVRGNADVCGIADVCRIALMGNMGEITGGIISSKHAKNLPAGLYVG